MAGALDIDDDMQRMVLRKGDASAKGGHASLWLLHFAELRDSDRVRRALSCSLPHRAALAPDWS